MDFLRSYFSTNATLTSCQHFLILLITFGWVQQQSNSKPIKKWWQNEKKWATGQSYIRKKVSSYKIHTLSNFWKSGRFFQILWPSHKIWTLNRMHNVLNARRVWAINSFTFYPKFLKNFPKHFQKSKKILINFSKNS